MFNAFLQIYYHSVTLWLRLCYPNVKRIERSLDVSKDFNESLRTQHEFLKIVDTAIAKMSHSIYLVLIRFKRSIIEFSRNWVR